LASILITIGIFIPIIIERFLKTLPEPFPTTAEAVASKYFCLAGFYMIIYCLVYLLKKNDSLVELLLIVNITLVGLVTISLSAIELLSRLALYFQTIVLISLEFLVGMTFVVLPVLIFLFVLFKLIRSR
jgi:hypothetical protein